MLLGTIASHGLGARGGDFDSIATAVGTGSSGTITFSSIPATYKHLQLRVIARNTNVGTGAPGGNIRINGDSGANYSNHILYGNGANALTYTQSSTSTPIIADIVANGNAANIMSSFIIDILDYASTSKYKTIRCLYGWDLNGSGIVALNSVAWLNTAAVDSISIIAPADNFTTTSSFALYGIRG